MSTMKFNPLYNFISPVTGRIRCESDYVLVGDDQDIATPSPALIDFKLDLINVRNNLAVLKTHYTELTQADFVIGSPNEELPNSQVLSVLNNGFMFNTGGVVSTTNDIPLPSLAYKNIWIGDSNSRPAPSQTITIDNLPNLSTASLTIPNPTDPTNPITISGGKIWHGTDSNRPEESTALLIVEGDIALINFRFFSANFILGKGNAVLQTLMPGSQFLSNLPAGSWMQTSQTGTGAIVSATIPQGQILMGGVNNIPEPQARIQTENLPLLAQNRIWVGDVNSVPQSTQVLDISNLPTLSNGMVWQGDATNRPTEIQLNFAPSDATYIIKQPNANLANAQALSELLGGILKSAPVTGTLSNAIGGVDYATQAAVTAAQSTADAAAIEAAAAPAAGAALAATYFAAQMLPYLPSPIPFTGPGTQISALIAAAAAAAVSAASSASSAQSTANNANTRIDNLTVNLIGDIIGTSNIANPIITEFTPNPKFKGEESIRIPTGNIAKRPSNPEAGMLRYNIEI